MEQRFVEAIRKAHAAAASPRQKDELRLELPVLRPDEMEG
jgi:hypothetical protein